MEFGAKRHNADEQRMKTEVSQTLIVYAYAVDKRTSSLFHTSFDVDNANQNGARVEADPLMLFLKFGDRPSMSCGLSLK
jgi:hypothetical protein